MWSSVPSAHTCKQYTCHRRMFSRVYFGSRSSVDALNLCGLITIRAMSSLLPQSHQQPLPFDAAPVPQHQRTPTSYADHKVNPQAQLHLGGHKHRAHAEPNIKKNKFLLHILLRRSQRPCLRVRLTMLALDDWRHRYSSRKVRQVSPLQEFITLKENSTSHSPHRAQGKLLQDTHTSGNRAGTEIVHRKHSS